MPNHILKTWVIRERAREPVRVLMQRKQTFQQKWISNKLSQYLSSLEGEITLQTRFKGNIMERKDGDWQQRGHEWGQRHTDESVEKNENQPNTNSLQSPESVSVQGISAFAKTDGFDGTIAWKNVRVYLHKTWSRCVCKDGVMRCRCADERTVKCSTFIRPSKNISNPRGNLLSGQTKTDLKKIRLSFDGPVKVDFYGLPSFNHL